MSESAPSSPPTGPEGVLYSCSGEFYIAEALRSARSSLRFNRLPHVLYTTGEVADEQPAGLTVVRFEPSANPYADKIANMRRSPFKRTLYLDTDTYVIDDVTHLLALLDRFDMAVAYTAEGRGPHDPGVPPAFYEFNTGVLAWRASERMAAFMSDWEQTYIQWREHGDPFPVPGKGSSSGRADQLAFRRCAWEHDISIFVLAPEYNFRVGYPTTVGARVGVIHGRHPDFEGLAARINESGEVPRSWPPPLPPGEKVMRRVRRLFSGLRPSS